MKEYDNFEKDCANSNANTRILQRQLNDDSVKIIITTIQKLATLLQKRDQIIQSAHMWSMKISRCTKSVHQVKIES